MLFMFYRLAKLLLFTCHVITRAWPSIVFSTEISGGIIERNNNDVTNKGAGETSIMLGTMFGICSSVSWLIMYLLSVLS